MAGESIDTFDYKIKAMMEVLGVILKLKNGDAVLTPKFKGLILELDDEFMWAKNRVRCRSILE